MTEEVLIPARPTRRVLKLLTRSRWGSELNSHRNQDRDSRATLERYYLLSSFLPFWFAIELLLVVSGIANMIANGLGHKQGLPLLLAGAFIALAHLIWVKTVLAYLDRRAQSKPQAPCLRIIK